MKTFSAEEARAERERFENSGRLHWFHWAIIIASLFLTLGAWYFTKTQHETQINNRFAREANQTIDLVQERLGRYEDILNGGSAAIQAEYVHLDFRSWKNYSDALQIERKYPGVNGIGVIDQLPRDELETYLADQRIERPDFAIHPLHDEDELFPIVFLAPLENNESVIGLDIAHEANRYLGAQRARETGQAQITGPIILVQDAERTPGFLFFVPFYANGTENTVESRLANFSGLVYAPFIVKKLMSGTLENERRQVSIKISDDGTALFDEHQSRSEGFDAHPMFKLHREVEIYGRVWTFDIWSNAAFNAAAQNNKPTLILVGGLAIDALLLTLFSLLARANRGAIVFANKMAEAQQSVAMRLQNIFDNSLDGIMTINSESQIESFNAECEKLFGYAFSEISGSDVSVILPDFHQKQLDDSDQIIAGAAREITGAHKNGTLFQTEVSLSKTVIEDRVFYSAIIRDVSDRKQSERWLREAMDDLILSNNELEKFAYVASHDLKSPLRGIDNLSKWLEEDLEPVLNDENRERIHALRGRVSRMEDLLDALLEYSRAGRISETSQTVNAAVLVSDISSILNVPEGFTIQQNGDLERIEVNRMPLEQVLHNLISNALKHHDRGDGNITVSAAEDGDYYRFSVTDDGPGIAPEYHGKIFEMFQTLRPRDEVEGSGMGLALVKKIIHNYGGRISVQSALGEGTVFEFYWPKAPKKRSTLNRQNISKFFV